MWCCVHKCISYYREYICIFRCVYLYILRFCLRHAETFVLNKNFDCLNGCSETRLLQLFDLNDICKCGILDHALASTQQKKEGNKVVQECVTVCCILTIKHNTPQQDFQWETGYQGNWEIVPSRCNPDTFGIGSHKLWSKKIGNNVPERRGLKKKQQQHNQKRDGTGRDICFISWFTLKLKKAQFLQVDWLGMTWAWNWNSHLFFASQRLEHHKCPVCISRAAERMAVGRGHWGLPYWMQRPHVSWCITPLPETGDCEVTHCISHLLCKHYGVQHLHLTRSIL